MLQALHWVIDVLRACLITQKNSRLSMLDESSLYQICSPLHPASYKLQPYRHNLLPALEEDYEAVPSSSVAFETALGHRLGTLRHEMGFDGRCRSL